MKNKKTMFIIIFFCSWIFIASALLADNDLLMNVKMEQVSRLPYLPIYFDIEFYNTSSQDILFPHKNFFRDYLHFIVKGSQQDMRCSELNETDYRIADIKLFTIKSGETYIYILDVARYAGILDPGTYHVKVVWDSRKVPKGYQGYAESQWIDIQIDESAGEDKLMLDAFIKLYKRVPKCTLEEGIISANILSKYPGSIYAGWALSKYIGNPESAEPNKIKELIDKGLYPISNFVPDPDSGSRKEIRSKEMAQWQIKWAEIILKNHPEFLYSRRLTLAIAINSVVLGRKDQAIKILKNIAEQKNTPEGKWAAEYLSIIH